MNTSDFSKSLTKLKGKNIAIVYTFQSETLDGLRHYDYWKSPVISSWLQAIEEIECVPYICDVRTFSIKAMENTLPKLDLVINLNAGNSHLEALSLIPSVCGVIGVKQIPNTIAQIVTGEHKHYSNLIATALDIKVPQYVSNSENFILRPMTLGSSIGVSRQGEDKNKLKQEFIQGCEVTTPILYNPLKNELEVLPSVYYIPDSKSVDWYHSVQSKAEGIGYTKCLTNVSAATEKRILNLAREFGIRDFCRIDWRLKAGSFEILLEKTAQPLKIEDLYFLEINSMPTISPGNNYLTSLKEASLNHNCFSLYTSIVKKPSLVGYILTVSMMAAYHNQAL